MSSFESNTVTSNTSTSMSSPRRKRYDDPKYLIQKKFVKDLETYQVAVLLGLLNKVCSFTLFKPKKESVVGICSAKLKSINFNGDEIDIIQLAENMYRPIYDREVKKGVAKPTAFRRYEKNKRVFVHNLLFDLALEHGFFFNSKLSRKSTKTHSIERIEKVFFNGKMILDLQHIAVFGSILNDYFYNIVKNDNCVIVAPHDESLSNILV
ncbi:hypothetical protein EIN_404480 [Entamoeba invadens IP1]|uniref:Uncharacterized protein n=1 Tax=Entamoeba invadens IP1 TaxID=370355 RepID=A0A0A1UCN3_ENTIV|nr:hypothetical protein EIN_404480 [Entamoeba invadens IP1]ELP90054.1 hypothetical protein EIN_404480 [Entamoeba invadens IP1]|eukprot:XP_004256825.1 hypothetical protein EIN_404480 [Entamoeba invadens IP1]